jgi:molybdopterin synthase catalytic subunit
MRIIVKCFAGCRDAVGATSVSVELPAGATVGEAFAGLIETYPALAGYDRSVMLAVNREYADRKAVLEDGDELACIPPVSGGADRE